MCDYTKTTALFRSIIKQYECFCIESVEIVDETITVTLSIDSKNKEPYSMKLFVALNTRTEMLTMHTKVIFYVEPNKVSKILSTVNSVQFSVFTNEGICYPIYLGPMQDGKHHQFFVTTSQRFPTNFVNNRPDVATVSSCQALINLFVTEFTIIFNTLYPALGSKEATEKRKWVN